MQKPTLVRVNQIEGLLAVKIFGIIKKKESYGKKGKVFISLVVPINIKTNWVVSIKVGKSIFKVSIINDFI